MIKTFASGRQGSESKASRGMDGAGRASMDALSDFAIEPGLPRRHYFTPCLPTRRFLLRLSQADCCGGTLSVVDD